MFKTPIGRLRFVALAEGVSYLVLLGIAMPLKYMGGIDSAVQVTGWIHGILFIAFCLALVLAMYGARLSIFLAGAVFIASLIPFAPFFIDRRLKLEEQREEAAQPEPEAALR